MCLSANASKIKSLKPFNFDISSFMGCMRSHLTVSACIHMLLINIWNWITVGYSF